MDEKQERILSYTVVFEPGDEGGGFTVTVPALPGVVTEGDSLEEARAMAMEAIGLHLESLRSHGEDIPVERDDYSVVLEKLTVRVAG